MCEMRSVKKMSISLLILMTSALMLSCGPPTTKSLPDLLTVPDFDEADYDAETVGLTVPVLIKESKVTPEYPERARRASENHGYVKLRAIVRSDGSVSNLEVLECIPKNWGFQEAAIEAVRQWRYQPGALNGKPVNVEFTIEIGFRIPLRP